MSGDYKSLAEVVREPMRRWWWRVTPWWVGALLLYLLWLIVNDAWLVPGAVAGTLPIERLKQLNLIGDVLGLAFSPGTRLLWILAALAVNAIITEHLRATGQVDGSPTTSVRFALGMQQVWILLVVSTLCNVAVALAGWYTLPTSVGDRPSLWHTLAYAFTGPLMMISGMVWFIALLAILHQRPKLLWWWFGMYTLLPAAWGLALGAWIALGLSINMTAGSYPGDYSAVPWAVGLVILLALIDGFHSRRSFLAYGAYALAILGALLNSFSGLTLKALMSLSWVPTSWQVGLLGLSNWQQALGYLPAGAGPIAYGQDMVASGAKVCLFQADWIIAQGHESLVVLALALNVIWLALLYAFLRYVVLRPYPAPKVESTP